jgi:hypothetical protein
VAWRSEVMTDPASGRQYRWVTVPDTRQHTTPGSSAASARARSATHAALGVGPKPGESVTAFADRVLAQTRDQEWMRAGLLSYETYKRRWPDA